MAFISKAPTHLLYSFTVCMAIRSELMQVLAPSLCQSSTRYPPVLIDVSVHDMFSKFTRSSTVKEELRCKNLN